MQKLQQDDTTIWNEKWKVLFRVLESPAPTPQPSTSRGLPRYPPDSPTTYHHTERHITTAYHDVDYPDSETASVLTEDERERWRQIITTESTLRKLLTEATYREDYERISRDTRFEKLFEPEKWDVIIRTISYPENPPQGPYRPHDDDRLFSDSTSEVSTSTVSSGLPIKPTRMYRKRSSDTTGTDGKSITDVRSMTEMMVDFTDHHFNPSDDSSSVVSSMPGAPVRSIADRSSTEIVEFAPLEETDTDSSITDIPPGNNFETVQTRHHTQTVTQQPGGVVQQTTTSSTNLYTTRSRHH